MTDDILGTITQNVLGAFVEHQHIAFGIHHHDTVHRTADDVLEKAVGLAELLFDLNALSKIAEVQAGDDPIADQAAAMQVS